MKTFKKFMVMMFAGIMAFGSYLAYPLSKIVAFVSAESTHEVVKVKEVPTSLNMKENASVVIPFSEGYFTTTEEGVKTVRVYNGMGRVEKEYNATSDDFKFTPTSAGTYTIVYGLVNGSDFKRISGDFHLVVTGENTSFKFTENSEFFLPAKVPAKAGQKVNIPYPTVVLNDGTLLNHGDEGYNVLVRVSSKEGSLRLHEEDGYQYVELEDTSDLGVYEVRYSYNNDSAILIKNFEVVNKDNFDTSKLSYTASISSWTEGAIRYKGEEITLPTLTVKDSNSNDVTAQVYNKISVSYYSDKTIQANTDNSIFTLNGNKLTVLKDAKTDGSSYYEIKYNVKDYFGNNIKEFTFKITNVSSYRNTPVVYAVQSYTAETNKDEIVSYDYVIPSTFNYIAETRDTLTIPAVYAEDEYGSTEFTYRRTIRYSGETSTVIEADYNTTTTYQFTKTGKYILSYTATSTLTGKSYTKDYTIVVVDGTVGSNESVDSTPEIKLPTMPSVMNAGETITIAVPVVKDKDSKNTIIDERVMLEVTGATPVIEDHEIVAYTITAGDTNTLTVTFTATNDNGTFSTATKTIKVLTADETPADVNITTDAVVDNANSIVSLPTITFVDDNIDYSDISVTVYDPNGNIITGIKGVTILDGVVSGGEFVAGLTGKYTMIYTAIDPYSNATSIAVVVSNVTGSTSYIQTGIDSAFPTNIEPNEKVTLPGAVFQLNGEVVNDVDYRLRVISAPGSAYTINLAREFKASEEGQYVFAYFLNGEKVSGEYTLTVGDNTKPELNISDSYRPQTVVAYEEGAVPSINIPTFKPSDANGIADYGFKVTKDGKSFVEYDAEKLVEKFYTNGEPTVYTFVPDGDGVYEVEYYATDNSGNKTTYNLDKINVGDVDTPVIIINADIPTTVDKGETVSFKTSDIVIDDSSANSTYKVTVTDPNGKTVASTGADGIYAYKLDEAGDYTMTITADDGHEHTVSEVKTITVTTEKYSSKVNTEVLGIILIVVSLLILGGVIFYFIKTRDKKPKTEKTI